MIIPFQSTVLVALATMVVLTSGCQTEPDISCSRVYLDLAGAQELQYEVYIPAYQEYAYRETRLVFVTDTTRHLYFIDRNIYMNRPAEMVGDKVIDHTTYLRACGGQLSETDTLVIMRKLDDGRYSEYVLKGHQVWKVRDEARLDATSENEHLVVDAALQKGEMIATNRDTLRIDRVDAGPCYRIQHVVRRSGSGEVRESWLGDLLLHRQDANLEIRLSTIDGQPLAAYLADLCDA
ncbi:MAG: hypothetical protein R3301_02260 [Saprospiraceae bacterium]|nr:hypothetical protein [Saprospiraceae bacterium]